MAAEKCTAVALYTLELLTDKKTWSEELQKEKKAVITNWIITHRTPPMSAYLYRTLYEALLEPEDDFFMRCRPITEP